MTQYVILDAVGIGTTEINFFLIAKIIYRSTKVNQSSQDASLLSLLQGRHTQRPDDETE